MNEDVITLFGSIKYNTDPYSDSKFRNGHIIIHQHNKDIWSVKIVLTADLTECSIQNIRLSDELTSYSFTESRSEITIHLSDDSFFKFIPNDATCPSTIESLNYIKSLLSNILNKKKEQFPIIAKSPIKSICPPPPPNIFSHMSSTENEETESGIVTNRDLDTFNTYGHLRGFFNYGTNCYANSILQLLRKCVQFLVSLKQIVDSPISEGGQKLPVAWKLLRTYEVEDTDSYENSSVLRLIETISNIYPVFDINSENDAREFVGYLLDAIDEEFEALEDKAGFENPVKRDFGLFVEKKIICKECKHSVTKNEYFSILTLYPPHSNDYDTSYSLQQLLKTSMTDEGVEFTCSKCPNQFVDINLCVIRPPRYFLLHVNRISPDSSDFILSKTQEPIIINQCITVDYKTYPNADASPISPLPNIPLLTLDSSPDLTGEFIQQGESDQSSSSNPSSFSAKRFCHNTDSPLSTDTPEPTILTSSYSVDAIVNHYGTYASSGHYTCDIMIDQGRWISCNDLVLFRENDEMLLLNRRASSSYLYLFEKSQFNGSSNMVEGIFPLTSDL